jgi:hypothetical protein
MSLRFMVGLLSPRPAERELAGAGISVCYLVLELADGNTPAGPL